MVASPCLALHREQRQGQVRGPALQGAVLSCMHRLVRPPRHAENTPPSEPPPSSLSVPSSLSELRALGHPKKAPKKAPFREQEYPILQQETRSLQKKSVCNASAEGNGCHWPLPQPLSFFLPLKTCANQYSSFLKEILSSLFSTNGGILLKLK